MYVPGQFLPDGEPIFLVVHDTRATGATYVDVIDTDEQHAANMARINEGYVLKIEVVRDFRTPRTAE